MSIYTRKVTDYAYKIAIQCLCYELYNCVTELHNRNVQFLSSTEASDELRYLVILIDVRLELVTKNSGSD